jgi:hypothetical protein
MNASARCRVRVWSRAVASTALCWAVAASAGDDALGLPTPADGGPVVVRVGFDLRDINEIDDEAEVFEFEGVLVLEWHDPRQAFDPAVAGTSERIYQGDYQFNELAPSWYPQVVLENESGLFETQGVLLRARSDGAMRLVQSLNAIAKVDLDLRRYPFDGHHLEAVFEVLGFDESEVVLLPSEKAGFGNRAPEMRIPQWELASVASSVRRQALPHAGDRGVASTYVVSMDVERRSLFMVRLVILPLALIVMLSWSVFWMDQSSVGDRVNVSFIGILTVVAYQIVLSEILPRISYLTMMNGFLNVSFFVMCAGVVVSLRVSWLDRNGQRDAGDRVDQVCRWLFPLVYVGSLGLIAAIAFSAY